MIYIMKDIESCLHVTVKTEEELTNEELMLVNSAKEASRRSYAPYSEFHVGASVLLDDGTVLQGSNQENCAFPSGMCAERTAIFYANSQYPNRSIKSLCIAAHDEDGNFTRLPVTPCGGCRQVMLESEKRSDGNMRIIMYGTEFVYIVESASSLLPLQFGDDEGLIANR